MSGKRRIDAEGERTATLEHSGGWVRCENLQDAIISWQRLPSEYKTKATIKVKNGPLYAAHEIEHLRYGVGA
jgi:hypothetical protein